MFYQNYIPLLIWGGAFDERNFMDAKWIPITFSKFLNWWLSYSFLMISKGGEVFGWLHCFIFTWKNIFKQCFQEYIFYILMSFKEKIVFMQSMFVIIKKGEIVELRFSCCRFDDSKCWIKIIWIYFYSMWKIYLLLKSYYLRFYLG